MANEKRLIDANSDFILKDGEYVFDFGYGYINIYDPNGIMLCQFDIDDIPTVDAVEVVHGRWRGETEEEQPHIVLRQVVCSVCNGKTNGRYNYCPHCAAKMDLEEA